MKYLIDSANPEEIGQALAWGACGITANPSMYRAQKVQILDFLQTYTREELEFLSGEVVADDVQTMPSESPKSIPTLSSKSILVRKDWSFASFCTGEGFAAR